MFPPKFGLASSRWGMGYSVNSLGRDVPLSCLFPTLLQASPLVFLSAGKAMSSYEKCSPAETTDKEGLSSRPKC